MHITTPIVKKPSSEDVVRIAVALTGIVAATLVILLGAVYPAASWLFLFLGVTLAAVSARAARRPNLMTLSIATVSTALIPLILLAL